MSTLPVFIWRQPDACAAVSVCSDRITQRSSANFAVCGKSSLIGRPLWPCLANRNGDFISRPMGRPFEPMGVLPVIGGAVELGEGRLGVERVDLARSAVHEQEDGVLRLRGEMRGPGTERVQPLAWPLGAGLSGKEAIPGTRSRF